MGNFSVALVDIAALATSAPMKCNVNILPFHAVNSFNTVKPEHDLLSFVKQDIDLNSTGEDRDTLS